MVQKKRSSRRSRPTGRSGSHHGDARHVDRKYIIVRANSTSGPYIVEPNEAAPRVNAWTRAHVYGYASTKRDADKLARAANLANWAVRGDTSWEDDRPISHAR